MKEIFVIVEWPASQDFIGKANCHPINDDKGLEVYGSSAYFVRADVYKRVTGINILESLCNG